MTAPAATPRPRARFRTVLALTLTLLGSIAGARATVAAEATGVPAPDSTVATIILVRHAERDTMLIGPDHPLRAVGHSNTVPEIITALTGRPFPTPGRVAYDGMWVVSLARDGRASLVTLRYGAPADGAPERHGPPTPPGR